MQLSGRKMKEKLLVIMYQNFNFSFGATRKYSEMIEYLAGFFDIILLSSRSGETKRVKYRYEVKILPPYKKDISSNNFIFIILKYILFYANQLVLITKVIFKHGDIHFIHIRHDTYSGPSVILLKLFNKKIIADGKIFSSYLNDFDKRLKILHPLLVLYEKYLLKCYWKFYVYSESYKDELIHYGLKEEELFFIPPSININNIPKYPLDGKNYFNIAYFGELHDYSNVKFLIDAFIELKAIENRVKLYIIGDGECYSRLLEYSRNNKYKDDIIFTGYLEKDALFQYFKYFSILVNPTKKFSGAESTKKIEALSAGKIIFEVMPENENNMKNPDTITYFDGNNSHDLVSKIIDLINDFNRIRDFQKKSLILSKEYDIVNYLKLVKLIQSIEVKSNG